MTFCFRNQCINLYYFSVLNGNQDHGKIMMLSMIYMNLRCNDAADAFCKNIPVRRQCGRIYLVFSLDCWGLGLFATNLMWTDEVGRWLFEMSIKSCSMPLSGHRRHIITIFLVLEFGVSLPSGKFWED